jgi:hypothetical protein
MLRGGRRALYGDRAAGSGIVCFRTLTSLLVLVHRRHSGGFDCIFYLYYTYDVAICLIFIVGDKYMIALVF